MILIYGFYEYKIKKLTLITQDATPVYITYALPRSTVAVSVLTSRIRHALIAQLALPSFAAP
jgi:hypothetical protein